MLPNQLLVKKPGSMFLDTDISVPLNYGNFQKQMIATFPRPIFLALRRYSAEFDYSTCYVFLHKLLRQTLDSRVFINKSCKYFMYFVTLVFLLIHVCGQHYLVSYHTCKLNQAILILFQFSTNLAYAYKSLQTHFIV